MGRGAGLTIIVVASGKTISISRAQLRFIEAGQTIRYGPSGSASTRARMD